MVHDYYIDTNTFIKYYPIRLTEPLLQWSYGTPQSSLPVGTVDSVRLESSPCGGDVVLVVPSLSSGEAYIGVTYTGFEDGQVQWYQLGSGCNNVGM